MVYGIWTDIGYQSLYSPDPLGYVYCILAYFTDPAFMNTVHVVYETT